MSTLCPPYFNAKLSHISQRFGAIQGFDGKPHLGVDLAPYNGYGIFLVAPENCTVEKIIENNDIYVDKDEMQRGFGILLKSTTSQYYYLYWHCLPFFPIKVGETVLQGQPVAQMGNTGMVYRNGVYVPLEERTKTKEGTHAHWEMCSNYYSKRYYVDPLQFIDWSIKINNPKGILVAISNIITKIKSVWR
jgi:murein DD-endopeptidase MepM/ murein hydrolase activator NlpD